MGFFSKAFKNKEPAPKNKTTPGVNGHATARPQWSDAWLRTRVDPDEVAELLRECTAELKSRALDIPFLLLPFRPSTETSAARMVVRNYFSPLPDRDALRGRQLATELRMTDAMALASVIKWCWSRLPGGVVTWETYDMFNTGERESHFARDAFSTFIPISVESDARVQIIKDFFDLLSAVAAHGKSNGLAGLKLSRYAGWWAFEHYDTGKGFEAGYRSWTKAADATSHLFFAYLRSMSPESSKVTNGILGLPRSLQQLLDATDYPPSDSLMMNETTKVVMIVDTVSPTPYSLLRRAKNFEYRDDDRVLQEFASYDDPVHALTNECQRVLKAISSINQSASTGSKVSGAAQDPSWSRFEDMGFGSTIEEKEFEDHGDNYPRSNRLSPSGVSSSPRSPNGDFGRPTTPSWADFLSSGFVDENGNRGTSPLLLPPDKILPPINSTFRGQSSQSHRRDDDQATTMEPGELASINKIDVDDAFWWVWISSLAGEEPTSRKAAFGRCALIETVFPDGKWLVMEEQVKGAAPEPAVGAYTAEKKGFFSKRGRLTRRRSNLKKSPLTPNAHQKSDFDPSSRTTIGPAQQQKIHQAAAELSRKNQELPPVTNGVRRGRDAMPDSKTNSVFTLQPLIKAEASSALQWASQYDKNTMRAKYLGTEFAGKGAGDLHTLPPNGLGIAAPPPIPKESPAIEEPHRPPRLYQEALARQPSPAPRRVESPPITPAPEREGTPSVTPPPEETAPLPTEPHRSTEPEVAAEAAQVPLPSESTVALETTEPTLDPPVRQSDEKPKPRSPPSPAARRLKKRPGPPPVRPGPPPAQKSNGIRRLFGTKRSSSGSRGTEPVPSPSSPVETNPAILAARRALEGKDVTPTVRETKSPEPSPRRANKVKNSRSPIAAVQAVTRRTPSPPARPPSPQEPEETREPVNAPPPVPQQTHHDPPQTGGEGEYDQLSRVDTNEREHADKEFSTFDQGPLVEQPAFAPQESPSRSGFFTPEEEMPPRPQHQSIYSAVTVGSTTTDDGPPESPGLTQQVSASDRWAQIRKNAAERAGRGSEDLGNRSRTGTRTDDDETSGEETIESRVARIKARVAELTGNMDTNKR